MADEGYTFEWDPNKERRNLEQHGVSFELAMQVWADPLHSIFFDRWTDQEERWHAVGRVGTATLLVVHIYPDPQDPQHIRIVGARKATRNERYDYEEGSF